MVISVLDDLCVVGKLRISAFQRHKDHRERKSPRKDMNHSCQSPSSHSSRYIIILYNNHVDYYQNAIVPFIVPQKIIHRTKVRKSIVPWQKREKTTMALDTLGASFRDPVFSEACQDTSVSRRGDLRL